MNNMQNIIEIGIIGLGAMGYNFGLNLISKGYIIHGYDKNFNKSKVKNLKIYPSISKLYDAINSSPKVIMLSLPNNTVDKTILKLIKIMNKNDILVDLGNSFYLDSVERSEVLKKFNLNFLGIGVSGGPTGARNGPSIMVGGSKKAWFQLNHLLKSVAAKENNQTSCVYFGGPANGHFIKMVHNGIEYAFMQTLAEVSTILSKVYCINYVKQKEIFKSFLNTNISCYLLKVTSEIISAKSKNKFFIDEIDFTIGQNGTGNWTVKSALDLSVSVPTIYSALSTRNLSKDFNIYSNNIEINNSDKNVKINQSILIDLIMFVFSSALFQGISMINAYNENFSDKIKFRDVFKAWANGSILQGKFLNIFFKKLKNKKTIDKSYLKEFISSQLKSDLLKTRSLINISNNLSIPLPVITSSFNYYDTLFTSHKIGEIIQLQRSYFGQHKLKDKKNNIFIPKWVKK